MIDTAVEQMKLYSIKKMPSCANELIDRNLHMCYPIIISCSDYPSFTHYDSIESRTISISRREGVCLSKISWEERTHMAVIGCYSVLRNYATCGKAISFIEYVENRLPLKYIRILKDETKGCRVGNITYTDDNYPYETIPQSPKEYVNMYVKDNVSQFTKKYFPYLGRTNMYRIIRKLDIS